MNNLSSSETQNLQNTSIPQNVQQNIEKPKSSTALRHATFLALFPLTGIFGIHNYLLGEKSKLKAHLILILISVVTFLFSLTPANSNIGLAIQNGFLQIISNITLLTNLIFSLIEGKRLGLQLSKLTNPKSLEKNHLHDLIFAGAALLVFIISLIIVLTSDIHGNFLVGYTALDYTFAICLAYLIISIYASIAGSIIAQKHHSISSWTCLILGIIFFVTYFINS